MSTSILRNTTTTFLEIDHMGKTLNFVEIEEELGLVRVKNKELRDARASAIRTAIASRSNMDLARSLVGDKAAKKFAPEISRVTSKQGSGCASIHLCVALEQLLRKPGGSLFRVVYYTEQENWKTVKQAYGLTTTPHVLQRGQSLPTLTTTSPSTGPVSSFAELCIQRGYIGRRSQASAHKLAMAVYPDKKQSKKYDSLRNRLMKIINGTKKMGEADAIEIAPILKVAPSSLLSIATSPGKPEGGAPPPPPPPPTRKSAAAIATDALVVSVSVPALLAASDVSLTYDSKERTFHGGANGSSARIRRTDTGYALIVSAEIDLPPESASQLLALLLT